MNGKQSDTLDFLRTFAASTVKLSDQTLRLVGLAVDRGLVSWNKQTNVITPLVSDEDIHSVDGKPVTAFEDLTVTDLAFLLTLMLGTWANAHSTTFPDGRSAADILRKFAGNAGL